MNEETRADLEARLQRMRESRPDLDETEWEQALQDLLKSRFNTEPVEASKDLKVRALNRMTRARARALLSPDLYRQYQGYRAEALSQARESAGWYFATLVSQGRLLDPHLSSENEIPNLLRDDSLFERSLRDIAWKWPVFLYEEPMLLQPLQLFHLMESHGGPPYPLGEGLTERSAPDLAVEALDWLRVGKVGGAVKCASIAHRRAPKLEAVTEVFIRTLLAAGRSAEAEDGLRALLAGSRNNHFALHTLGTLLLARWQKKEAVHLLTEAVRTDPDCLSASADLHRTRSSGGESHSFAQTATYGSDCERFLIKSVVYREFLEALHDVYRLEMLSRGECPELRAICAVTDGLLGHEAASVGTLTRLAAKGGGVTSASELLLAVARIREANRHFDLAMMAARKSLDLDPENGDAKAFSRQLSTHR